QDLGAPAGLATCVKPLATGETELLEQSDERGEIATRRAIGVVIVIGPAQSQHILPGSLCLGGSVPTLPVFAFGAEKQVTRQRDAQIRDGGRNQRIGVRETSIAVVVVVQLPPTRSKCFGVSEPPHAQVIGLQRRRKPNVSVPLDRPQPRTFDL